MRKISEKAIELDVEDRIAIEEAIIDKVEALAKRNDVDSRIKKENLKKIYFEMMCANVFIKKIR